MPGPLASANVGADTLGAVAEPTVALRELRREIRAAEAELTSLAAKGDKVSAQQTRNLEEMRRKEKAIVTIQKQQRETMASAKRALDIGQITKSLIGAQSLRRVMEGHADARDFAAFAFMAERQIVKGVKEIAGAKMARATRMGLRFVPFVGEILQMGFEGREKVEEQGKTSKHIDALIRAGKMPASVGRLYYSQLEDDLYGLMGTNPEKTAQQVMSAGRSLVDMNASEMRSAISEVAFRRETVGGGSAIGFGGGQGSFTTTQISEGKLDAAEVLRRYDELVTKDVRGGMLVTKESRRADMAAAIADMLKGDPAAKAIAEELVGQIEKKALEKKDDNERHIATRWLRADSMRKDTIEAKRHFIPSKLEF